MKKFSIPSLLLILSVVCVCFAASAIVVNNMLDFQVFAQPDRAHKDLPQVGNGEIYHIDTDEYLRVS